MEDRDACTQLPEEFDGGDLCRRLAAAPPPARRDGRIGRLASPLSLSAAALLLLVVPLAGAQVGAGGGTGGDAAGNERGEAVEIEVRNRSRGETGLVTASDGYSLRLSNTRENGGGGAVYGCRSQAGQTEGQERACLYADNLRGGEAFLFRSRQGSTAGIFELGNPAGTPFTTNATGRVANLNADRVDDLHASEIIGQARAKAGLAAETADSATSATTATTATNSTQLDGKGPTSYRPLAAFTSSNTNSSITAGVNNVLTITMTPPVQSRILVSSNVEVDADGGNDDDAFCYQNTSDNGVGASDISQRVTVDIPDTNLDRGNIANHGSIVVNGGETVNLRVFCGVNVGGQTIQFDSGDMHALAVPID